MTEASDTTGQAEGQATDPDRPEGPTLGGTVEVEALAGGLVRIRCDRPGVSAVSAVVELETLKAQLQEAGLDVQEPPGA